MREDNRGCGYACPGGIAVLDGPDIVMFLDADYSDYPSEMLLLVHSIVSCQAEMAIGSRIRGTRKNWALLTQARFGNALAAVPHPFAVWCSLHRFAPVSCNWLRSTARNEYAG